ncbi:hypothetical protein SALCHL_004089 [Streptomyces albus subsp. chlorinus]|uniref:hypothetical protein n=1 Tax=Streptomyces albus TaxID=1888 RepID=UPI003D09DB62
MRLRPAARVRRPRRDRCGHRAGPAPATAPPHRPRDPHAGHGARDPHGPQGVREPRGPHGAPGAQRTRAPQAPRRPRGPGEPYGHGAGPATWTGSPLPDGFAAREDDDVQSPHEARGRGIFGFEGIDPEEDVRGPRGRGLRDHDDRPGPGAPPGARETPMAPGGLRDAASLRDPASPRDLAAPPERDGGAGGEVAARAARRGAIAAYRAGTQRAAADARDAGRRTGEQGRGGSADARRPVADWWSTAPDAGEGRAPRALDDDVRWLPSDKDEVLPDELHGSGGRQAERDEVYGPRAAGPYGAAPPPGRRPDDSGPTALPGARADGRRSIPARWTAGGGEPAPGRPGEPHRHLRGVPDPDPGPYGGGPEGYGSREHACDDGSARPAQREGRHPRHAARTQHGEVPPHAAEAPAGSAYAPGPEGGSGAGYASGHGVPSGPEDEPGADGPSGGQDGYDGYDGYDDTGTYDTSGPYAPSGVYEQPGPYEQPGGHVGADPLAGAGGEPWDAGEPWGGGGDRPWDEAVAGGGRYRGPVNALAAERARYARMTVVGPVTERWAPEQAGPVHANWRLAPPVGPAADLWALGALLFRAVQGHAPYPEDSAAELVQMVCAEPPAFAEECGPLRPVVESLMRQDPTERPDFEELRGWLRSLIRSAPEPDVGLRTVTAPALEGGVPSDPRRLPIVRRRGELVRRRGRRGKRAAAERHPRRTRERQHAAVREPASVREPAAEPREPAPVQEPRPSQRRPEREAKGGGGTGPRRLGVLILALVLLGMAAAVAFVAYVLPDKGGGEGAQKGSVVVPDQRERAPDGTQRDDEGEGGKGGEDRSGRGGGASPSADGRRSATSGASGSSGERSAPKAPDGYKTSTDPVGFRIAVPGKWDHRSADSEGRVRYSPGPSGGDVEMVVVNGRGTTRKFGRDPMAYQSEDEPELAAYRASDWASTGGLRRIDVGGTAMAEGTFSWREDSGRQVYARNRAVILGGRYHVLLVLGSRSRQAEIDRHFEAVADTYRVTRAR